MKRTIVLVIALAVVISGIFAGLSLATPPSGSVGVQFGRSTFQHFRVLMRHDDIVVAENSFAPGGYSGWHSHPGQVVLAVQRGAITLFDANTPTCASKTYSAGQVFLEHPGHVYNGVNQSPDTAAVVNVTYFDVPVGGSFRIDQPQPPNCPAF